MLGERAVEHDAPGVLLALTTEHLHARKIIRPSLDRLMRLIATARAAAHARVETAVADQLTPERRAELDALLVSSAGGRSELARLKERAGRVGVAELRRQVQRYRRTPRKPRRRTPIPNQRSEITCMSDQPGRRVTPTPRRVR